MNLDGHISAVNACLEKLLPDEGRWPRTLHSAMRTLYRSSVDTAVAAVEYHIEEGRERLARQLRLVEQLAEQGHDTARAEALAREYGRVLLTMRSTREILTCRLAAFSD